MKTHLVALMVAIGSLALIACRRADRVGGDDLCPAEIKAEPLAGSSAIEWSAGKAIVKASLASLVLECYPAAESTNRADHNKVPALMGYEISATANITHSSNDAAREGDDLPQAWVVFEALSANGVVLVSSETLFKSPKRGDRPTLSTKLHLSGEQVRRVSRVQVHWKYEVSRPAAQP